MYGRIVMPIFYEVDPAHVRFQIGSLADAFAKHEQRYKDCLGKVQRWKDALNEAANLSGSDSRVIKPESVLIEAIVEDVLKRLNDLVKLLPCWLNDNFVGFGLCAVVAFRDHEDNGAFLYINFECKLKSEDGQLDVSYGTFGHFNTSRSRRKCYKIGSDHVYMGFDSTTIYLDDIDELYYDEAFFQFYFEGPLGKPIECCKVKKCGVHLMYAQDIGKPSGSFNSDDEDEFWDSMEKSISSDDEEALLKIQSLATLWKGHDYNENRHATPHCTAICFPGSEVPEGFSFRNLGSFISVKLPPGWLNDNFVGFGLCAVVEFRDHEDTGAFLEINFECKLKSEDGQWDVSHGTFSDSHTSRSRRKCYKIGSDHVYMGFDSNTIYLDDIDELCYDEVCFQFCLEGPFGKPIECCKVKKCGFRLMYA
ncbi:hypothetical protein LWI28_020782 [Acer negundo]|uniref:TIR domain-containing protein n=1 Tax=Acer negundo TaxID=4023 RepID=A0AAD5IJ60_ACENE|nr:hypothetical protein LWI28_020782 [Acer negundo]